ncbi:MAG: amidohydrolase family protein, partial [Planctomycetaceae bacterium]|nr:amidohydrolase family protein [Planctomycetaceae bacterium]
MPSIIIRNGRIIDPSQALDEVSDLLIQDGKIAAIGTDLGTADEEIEATGKIISPGLVDAHVQLREPGFEEDETIESGTAAAINGGFTSIACLPNTSPTTDTQAQVQFIQQKASQADNCHVFVIACVSKNREGQELAEMG